MAGEAFRYRGARIADGQPLAERVREWDEGTVNLPATVRVTLSHVIPIPTCVGPERHIKIGKPDTPDLISVAIHFRDQHRVRRSWNMLVGHDREVHRDIVVHRFGMK